MAKSCPIAFRTIDNTVSRLNSMSIGLLLIAYLLTLQQWILLLIIYDFTVRLYGNKNYSLIQKLSLTIQKRLMLKHDPIDAGAKRVAAMMGLGMGILLFFLSFTEVELLLYIIAAFFLICASMEFLISFCLGCEVYHIYKKFF